MTRRAIILFVLTACSAVVGGCKEQAAPAESPKDPQKTELISEKATPSLPSERVFALLHDEQCAATTLSDPDSSHTVHMPLAVVSGMETYDIRLAPEPALPPLNAPFSIDVTITDRTSENPRPVDEEIELHVDGWMPVHLHGLAVRPSILRTAPGVYKVSNLLLHMEGEWQLFFDVTDGPLTERAQIDLVIR